MLYTLIFNLYKYCLFIIAARNLLSMERPVLILNAVTIAAIVVNLESFGTLIGLLCSYDYFADYAQLEVIDVWFHWLVIGMFSGFLLCYTSVFIVLQRNLKKSYPNFYQRERKRLLIAGLQPSSPSS